MTADDPGIAQLRELLTRGSFWENSPAVRALLAAYDDRGRQILASGLVVTTAEADRRAGEAREEVLAWIESRYFGGSPQSMQWRHKLAREHFALPLTPTTPEDPTT